MSSRMAGELGLAMPMALMGDQDLEAELTKLLQ